MKKNDLPAMPFYVGDWMKCPEVRACSLSARGLWFDMLCLMWESRERGYLINPIGRSFCIKEISRIVGENEHLVNQNLVELRENGVYSIRESDGAIYCRRMVKDEHIRQVRRECGKLGGNPKLAYPNSQPKSNQITEDENEDENEIETEHESVFNVLWKAYPRKVGKGAAVKAWAKIKEPSATLEKILSALKWQTASEQWRRDNGQYIPHPATYINQRRWEDEPQQQQGPEYA